MTTTIQKIHTRFPLGSVYITREAKDKYSMAEIRAILTRHALGDWGDLGDEDREANENALIHGDRLLSAYEMQEGRRLWIITESDRSATTILFPEDY